jgi:hypothetical protein
MANYNYVAPIKYKTYSDMNKERLALKAAQDATKLKQQVAGSKQRQKYLDQLSGLSTEGWADLHRDEFKIKVQEAKNYVNSTPINELDFGSVADALMRMQDLGNSHAELRKGQDEYGSYIGPDAAKYDADLDWGISATHDKDGYDQRLSTFNNVGLVNYNNGAGDFPNPNYNPSATEGEASIRTMREVLVSQGASPDPNNSRNVIKDGQSVQVSGSAFDVAQGGFEGLWSPDLSPLNPYRAEVAFSSYTNDEESDIFVQHAKALNKKVEAREAGFSYREAQGALKSNILSYLNPESPLADKALMFSAIADYELPDDQGGTGQKWDDVSQDPALIAIHGTPWERFADKMVAAADLYDPDDPTSGRRQTEFDRKIIAFGATPVDQPDRQFTRELGAEDFDWGEAFRLSERSQEILDLTYEVDVLDSNGRPTGETKTALKDLGEGVRVHMGQEDIKFDAIPIDNVEVFADENLAIIYSTGNKPGDVGIDVGEEGDPWRYNPLFGGKEGIAPFRVINILKTDADGNLTGEYTEDYLRLKNQFDREYGYRNALQKKITAAEQARE